MVEKFIKELEAQLADRGVKISLDEKAKKYLAQQGYDKEYGARPLERLIDEQIKKYLADEILFGNLNKGGKVGISCKNDKLIFDF